MVSERRHWNRRHDWPDLSVRLLSSLSPSPLTGKTNRAAFRRSSNTSTRW